METGVPEACRQAHVARQQKDLWRSDPHPPQTVSSIGDASIQVYEPLGAVLIQTTTVNK